jgi:hypothetical protein
MPSRVHRQASESDEDLSKKKKKGRKRKGRLSEAAAKRARDRGHEYAMSHIPVHPDDLEGYPPASFEHSLKRTTQWRCLECKYGYEGMGRRWLAAPDSQEHCPRCRSTRVQQKNAYYQCLNCEEKFWDFPAPASCPSKKCKNIDGPRHPGDEEERGTYVEWLNYEELFVY